MYFSINITTLLPLASQPLVMTTVFESYEQQFSTITADITARINKIPNLTGTEKKTACGVVQGNIDESGELLEQMEVELHDLPPAVRPPLTHRMGNYRAELERLKKQFKQAQVALGDLGMRKELFGPEELRTSEDHRSTMMENTERLGKTANYLGEGKRIAVETEQIGLEIMDNLQRDRETINRARNRLHGTDNELNKGSRIVTRISRRIIQHKLIFAGLVIGLVVVVLIIIAIVVVVKFKVLDNVPTDPTPATQSTSGR